MIWSRVHRIPRWQLVLSIMVLILFLTVGSFLLWGKEDTSAAASTLRPTIMPTPTGELTPTLDLSPTPTSKKFLRTVSPTRMPTTAAGMTVTSVISPSSPQVQPTATWKPLILSTHTPTPQPTSAPAQASGGVSVSTTSVSVTLSKAQQDNGLIYGSGFTITSQGATGFQIKDSVPTQGQGFYETSGGMSNGSSSSVRSYISPNKGNGTYSGSVVVQYQSNGSWTDGPTVSYTITLTD